MGKKIEGGINQGFTVYKFSIPIKVFYRKDLNTSQMSPWSVLIAFKIGPQHGCIPGHITCINDLLLIQNLIILIDLNNNIFLLSQKWML